jgi:hypothetical protein
VSEQNQLPRKTKYAPLKRLAERDGIPYGSARDAHFRGELPVLKLGRPGASHNRWYVDEVDWQRWLESRKERVA